MALNTHQNSQNEKRPRGGCGTTETLILYWWEYQLAPQFWKPAWQFQLKLNIGITFGTPLTGREMCTHLH